ncbi:hypothetical protein ANN_19686 [Periplaneta americana]|uniref:Secreted protein n=1 Tax=Periplaneta americana TaxID=6978 RepID=A0ABQ8SBP2_PERAM|nr:hypothetical protein ANN_19686 [Periplaneta americana]
MTRPGNKAFIEILAVWLVAPFCWNNRRTTVSNMTYYTDVLRLLLTSKSFSAFKNLGCSHIGSDYARLKSYRVGRLRPSNSNLRNLSMPTKCYFENDERDSKRTRMTRRDEIRKTNATNIASESGNNSLTSVIDRPARRKHGASIARCTYDRKLMSASSVFQRRMSSTPTEKITMRTEMK